MATANVEILNDVAPKRIVTTCPHCLHTLKNEYPAFGGNYTVIHHTQLINELIGSGKLKLSGESGQGSVADLVEDLAGEAGEAGPPGKAGLTGEVDSGQQPPIPAHHSPLTTHHSLIAFHDPCYLGRHNDILIEPRAVLSATGGKLTELPNSGKKSFCCGAGGAQMWKEEEPGSQRVNLKRFQEAQASGADVLAVGCPFCMVMLDDAKKDTGSEMEVLDVAEIVARQLV
jgi:Fe-S oxidoreductase